MFDDLIAQASTRYGIPASWIRGVITIESSWLADAVSGAGAVGLMQVMPSTARLYGNNEPNSLLDPAVNIDLGSHILADDYAQTGDIESALSMYNSGNPSAYQTNAGVGDYVSKVLIAIQSYVASDPFVTTAGAGIGIVIVALLMWAWKKKPRKKGK